MNEIKLVKVKAPAKDDPTKEFTNFYLVLPSGSFIAIRCTFPKDDFRRLADIATLVTKDELKANLK